MPDKSPGPKRSADPVVATTSVEAVREFDLPAMPSGVPPELTHSFAGLKAPAEVEGPSVSTLQLSAEGSEGGNRTAIPERLKNGLEGLSGVDPPGARRKEVPASEANRAGRPDGLESVIDVRSGPSLADVGLHDSSPQVAQFSALAARHPKLPRGRMGEPVSRRGMDSWRSHFAGPAATAATGRADASCRHLAQQEAADVVQRVRNELWAWEIAFTQASVGSSFTEVPEGVPRRLAKLGASSAEIDKGDALPGWIQGLRVFSIKHPGTEEERIFSLDNRRLKVIKGSTLGNQVEIPVQWADFAEVIAECFKFTNRKIWEEAEITDQPTEEQRAIAPEGNLLGDFFADLVARGYVTAQGDLTGGGAGDVEGDWSFNQAE